MSDIGQLLSLGLNNTVARVLKTTQVFDDLNAVQTNPSQQAESLKSRKPRRGPRIGSNQGVQFEARIKSTISRDAKEQELPYLSFTKHDLGQYVDRELTDDNRSLAGSMDSQGRYDQFGRLCERVKDLTHEGSPSDRIESVSRRLTGRTREDDYSYVATPRNGRASEVDDQFERTREEDDVYSAAPPDGRFDEAILQTSNYGSSLKDPAAAFARRSNTTEHRTTELRKTRSLPELSLNSLGMEYVHRRAIDRTYLEHVSAMRLSGTNPMARFVGTLMDEISRLRNENAFLGEQLALQQQDPVRAIREPVAFEDSVQIRHIADGSRIIRRVSRRRRSHSSRSVESTVSSDAPDGSISAPTVAQFVEPSIDNGQREYQILHKIDCSSHRHSDVFRSNPPLVMTPQPLKSIPNEPKKLCLREQGVVVHPEDLILTKPNLSFIVIRIYKCADIASQLRLISDQGDNTTSVTDSNNAVTRNVFKASEECVAYLSRYLQKTLGDCAQCETVERDTYIHFPWRSWYLLSPYHFVHQHRLLLEAYACDNQGPTAEDIANLLKYSTEAFGEYHAAADNLSARGLVSKDHLLHSFRPNTLVFSKKLNQVFMLSSWPQQQGERLALTCWSWKYDGSSVIRQPMSLEIICDCEGPGAITDLDCYPIQFADNATQQLIRSRGEKFWNLKDPGIICYSGRNADDTDHHIEARFMIDYDLHKKYHPTSRSFLDPSDTETLSYDRYDRWPSSLFRGENVDKEMLMLMPLKIDGFNLQTKSWELLFVDNISKVKWHKAAFTRLVLPSKTKDLIRAMIVGRKVEKQSSDIFYGKGNGLVMLLHGSPGTGKTLSAESVAELAEKPLYRVTCGDIGTEVDDVEEYLDMILSIGKRWDCVLLLDEADVFLEERSLADLKRNSLVSVFLRVLEYYEGILILTSNRVGIFDEAFKSRIQVALHYDNLPRSARKKIWSNFFELLQEEQVDVDFAEIESHLDDLAAFELNGRQIRNAVTTARQLARFQNVTLDYDHIQTVMKTVNDFNRYIEKVHGHQDDKWARDGGLR